MTNLPTTDELRALLQCGIDDANDAGKVMHVEPSWMRHTCQLALDEIERLTAELESVKTQFAALPRSRLCAELHYALDEWQNAGAPTSGVVNATVNLIQHGLDADSQVEPEVPKI